MVCLIRTAKRTFGLVTMAALLAGCGTPPQPQYQSASRNFGWADCKALQAVIEDRERYGIVARSRDADEDTLRQCGLPHSGSDQQVPYQPVTSPHAQRPEEVPIERHGSAYHVPVRINDTITLPFLLDTGAADLVIPADVALTLTRAGALKVGDFVGKAIYSYANGAEDVRDRVVLREVQVGGHSVRNVTASINSFQAEPLLGQSFLSKFGTVTLDYKRLVLVLSP
jgi:predicted aspartyl protease